MATGLYTQANQSTVYAQWVNEAVQALTAGVDAGQMSLFAQIAAPGALTAAVASGAGNLTGNYGYVVTFVTGLVDGGGSLHTSGETNAGTASATVSPSAQNVSLTNIPIGPAGTIARRVYRTKAGGSTYFFDFQISDNTTTSWTDSTTDANLGTGTAPSSNTTGTSLSGVLSLASGSSVAGTISGAATWAAQQTFAAGAVISSGQTLSMSGAHITGAPTFNDGAAFDGATTFSNGALTISATGGTITGQPTFAAGWLSGNDVTVQASGSATSGSDYWSRVINLQSSHWTGSVATTYTGYIQLKADGSFYFATNGSGSNQNVLTVGPNSAITTIHSTLDDGAGAATFAGLVTGSKGFSTQDTTNGFHGPFLWFSGTSSMPGGAIGLYYDGSSPHINGALTIDGLLTANSLNSHGDVWAGNGSSGYALQMNPQINAYLDLLWNVHWNGSNAWVSTNGGPGVRIALVGGTSDLAQIQFGVSSGATTDAAGSVQSLSTPLILHNNGGIEIGYPQLTPPTNGIVCAGQIKIVTAGALDTTGVGNGNAGFEHGSTSYATTPFIDFHSSGYANDYDSRIMGSGGNATNGQGTLSFYAGSGYYFFEADSGHTLGHWTNTGLELGDTSSITGALGLLPGTGGSWFWMGLNNGIMFSTGSTPSAANLFNITANGTLLTSSGQAYGSGTVPSVISVDGATGTASAQKIQYGSVTVTISASNSVYSTTVTFPAPFASAPKVFVSLNTDSSTWTSCGASSITNTSCSVLASSGSALGPITLFWFAIGN